MHSICIHKRGFICTWVSGKLIFTPRAFYDVLKVLYSNVRSVARNSSYVSLVLANNYDVYAFSETWLKPSHGTPSVLGSLSLDYDIYRCDRPNKKGGGVMLIISRRFSFSFVYKESVEDAYEVLCGDISYDNSSFRMIVVYRTPSCLAVKTEQLFKVLSDLAANDKHVVIVGDFNIPDFHPYNKPNTFGATALHDFVFCHDFTQFVTQPTRGLNILDLVFSSSKNLIEHINVCSPLGMSDHNSVTFDIRCEAVAPTPVYRRVYSQCNFDEVCTALAQVRWRELLESRNSVNEKYELFYPYFKHVSKHTFHSKWFRH